MKRLLLLFLAFLAIAIPAGSASAQTTRIVGGTVAPPGSWPSIAAVFPGPYICGGTLIRSSWIMTAAHCVQGISASETEVALGQHNIASPSVVGVKAIKKNNNYNASTDNNDIALLWLKHSSSQPIARVALPSESQYFETGDTAYIAGWGTTCFDDPVNCPVQNNLREATINISDQASCDAAYGGAITDNMICAAAPGKDSCQGDSGGPMEVDVASGRAVIGIVSFGEGCADPSYPGVYTRASRYINWIGSHVVRSVAGPNKVVFKHGKKRTKTITIKNQGTGEYPASISSRKTSGPFKIRSTTCGKTLASGKSCRISIHFSPKKKNHKYKAYLNIKSSGGQTMRKICLTGKR